MVVPNPPTLSVGPVLPGIPTPTLSATPSGVSTINLVASYAGPPTLATYTFQFSLSAGFTSPTTLATQASPNYAHTGRTSGAPYYYRVNIQTAEVPSRTSAYSSIATATTTGLGAPGIPTFSATTPAQTQVAYTAASGAVTGYESQLNGGAFTNQGNVLTYLQTGLLGLTNPLIGVRAYDGAGNRSATSSATVTISGAVDNYPRLGTVMNGGQQQYKSDYQTYAAHIHVNVLGGGFEGWERAFGVSKETVIASIKAQSTIGSRVFQFGSYDQANPVAAGSANPIFVNKVISMNWWLYVNGTSGTREIGDIYPRINQTSSVPNDPATGLGPYGWGAKYANDLYHLGLYQSTTGTSAAPSLDGFFIDNVFWKPRNDGDWLRNGTTQLQTDSTAQYNFRAGEAQFAIALATLFPGAVTLGNIGDWPGDGVFGTSPTLVAPLSGVYGGGMFESAIGSSNSVENLGSQYLQGQYQYLINNVKNPKYLILSHDYVTFSGSDPYGPNWQAMRYGLCATLMNNGYYAPNTSPQLYDETAANRLWFDEFDGGGVLHANGTITGGLGVGYLGQPVAGAAGAVQTAAWSNGVWKREFANGIALWTYNSVSGGATATVSLSGFGNLKHLTGSQNPSLNNGANVTGTNVTLQARDGLILLRY